MRTFLLLLLFTLPVLSQPINGVAMLVEDRPITLHDIKEEMARNGQDQTKAIDTLVRRELEALETDKRGISVTDAEVTKDIKAIAEQAGISIIELYTNMQQSQNLSEAELKTKIREKLLSQKLFGAIAYEQVQQPDEDEIAEYYELHINEFSHPESFRVLLYRSSSEAILQQKISNPMFYNPQISQESLRLKYDTINPRLAQLLNNTDQGTFTPVLPDQNGYIAFFIQERLDPVTVSLENVRPQISNAIMQEKRTQVLNDYFTRLRLNTAIKTIRLP